MRGRGFLWKKIKDFFKEKNVRKELYVRTGSPEEYKNLVRKGVSLELAEKTREVMDLRKDKEGLLEYIEDLQKKVKGAEDEEITRQKTVLKRLQKSNEFDKFFEPENPITMISSYNSQPFNDEYGEPRPFLVGFRICADPYSSYIVPLLAKRPNERDDIASFKTRPPIYIKLLPAFFADLKLLVHKLRTGGFLEVNVTPDGNFIGDGKFPFQVHRIVPDEKPNGKEPKAEEKVPPKKKGNKKEGRNARRTRNDKTRS